MGRTTAPSCGQRATSCCMEKTIQKHQKKTNGFLFSVCSLKQEANSDGQLTILQPPGAESRFLNTPGFPSDDIQNWNLPFSFPSVVLLPGNFKRAVVVWTFRQKFFIWLRKKLVYLWTFVHNCLDFSSEHLLCAETHFGFRGETLNTKQRACHHCYNTVWMCVNRGMDTSKRSWKSPI